MVLDITVTPNRITINAEGARSPCKVHTPQGWKRVDDATVQQANEGGAFIVDFSRTPQVIFENQGAQ